MHCMRCCVVLCGVILTLSIYLSLLPSLSLSLPLSPSLSLHDVVWLLRQSPGLHKARAEQREESGDSLGTR